MSHHLRINTTSYNATVDLDGEEISTAIRGYTVTHDAAGLPKVTLDLARVDVDMDLDGAHVVIEQDTADMLRRLGWTAPEGQP